MAKEQQQQPTQRTPKGYEIPVPRKTDVFSDLKKVAKVSPEREQQEKEKDD